MNDLHRTPHGNFAKTACLALLLVLGNGCGGTDASVGNTSTEDAAAGGATEDVSNAAPDAAHETTPDAPVEAYVDAIPEATIDAIVNAVPDAQEGATPDGAQLDADSGAGDAGLGSDAADAAPVGLPIGADCSQDAGCASVLCKPVVMTSGGLKSVCVSGCTQQSDCSTLPGSFCEPILPGGTAGYCIPRSAAHCASCTTSGDCGSLSEICFQASGDIASACHVDCSIAGDAACPPDYSCVDATASAVPRKVCRPKVIPTCLDAIGGFCERSPLPIPCSRSNAAGTCLGQRTCLAVSGRFDKCGAEAPQCKASCSTVDPAGCTLNFCSGATITPANCGTCGHVCPGYQQLTDNVTCGGGTTCTFSCQGENFDVNANPADGCEIKDAPTGNHTQATASSGGSVSCADGTGMTVNLAGAMISDARVHENPVISGFSASAGAAPDFFTIHATGGTCVNDIALALQVTGSSMPTCYKLTVITNLATRTQQTGATGAAAITAGTGAYNDDTDISIVVEKTCSAAALVENVTYTVKGHL